MKIARLAASVAVAVTLAACGGVSSPSNYTPDDFSGTLTPGGEANRGFEVGGTGELQLELVSLNPAPRVGFLAMGVGRYAGGFCSPLFGYTVNQVAVGRPYALGRITKGSYCITIADANLSLTGPAAFTVRILHP
jgi:hypothetical protein